MKTYNVLDSFQKFDANYDLYARTIVKDGSVWFLDRSFFDSIGLHELKIHEVREVVNKLDNDNHDLFFGEDNREVHLINVSGIRELSSIFSDRKTEIQNYLKWISSENVLLQTLKR